MINKLKVTAFTFSLVFLGGCISTHPALNQPETIGARVDQDIRASEQARRIERRAERPTATRSRDIVRIPRGNDWLRDGIDFNYTNLPLSVALEQILGKRPVKFQLLQDARANVNSIQPGAAITLPDQSQFTAPGLAGGVNKYLNMPVSNPTNAPTVLQHLESIETQTGLIYSIEKGVVIFSDYELKVFSLGSTLVATELQSAFNNEVSGAGAVAANRGAILFGKVTGALGQLISPPNIFTADNLTNTVSVAADPGTLRRVEQYINTLNGSQKKQTRVRVDVYDVNLSALGQRSIDFAIENLASDISALSGVTTNILSEGNEVLNATNTIRFGVDRPGRSIDGANGLIRYLRQQGSLTSRQSFEFVLANNETKQQLRARVTPYVSKVSLTTNTVGIGNTSTAPTVETREANTGSSLQVSAAIVKDRVYLNMLLEESRLIALNPFSFGDATDGGAGAVNGLLPETEQVRSTHRLSLSDGETSAVGASIFSRREVKTQNGTFIPIVGDSVDKDEDRVQSLIVVTANIF